MAYYRATTSVDAASSDRSVSEVEAELETKRKDYIELCNKKAIYDKKADFRARVLLAMGSTIFIGQFGFIMAGTFVFFSWDIMEPISYVMMLGNFTLGMLFFAKNHEELQLTTLREMIAARFARGIYRRKGLDVVRLDQLQEEIKAGQEIINKSIY